MQTFRKIIFVCEDNTCCGIMAEAIMDDLLKNMSRMESLSCISRGLVVLFPEPLNPKAVDILQQNHLPVKKEATELLSQKDLSSDTLLLTMTQAQKRALFERFPKAVNLYTICEFANQEGDIRRPLRGGDEEYLALYEQMDLMVKLVARRLRDELRKENEVK